MALARTTIRELALNAGRYEVDLGEFPLSSSGTGYDTTSPNPMVSRGWNLWLRLPGSVPRPQL